MAAGGIWIAFRAELRRHRGSFAIAVVVAAIAAGAVMTAAAGARRSDTSYARFLKWSHFPDVFAGGGDDETIPHDIAALEHAPFVESSAHTYDAGAHIRTATGEDVPSFVVHVDSATVFGSQAKQFREKVLSGRAANQTREDEATIGFSAAERLKLHVGDKVSLVSDDDAHRVYHTKIVGVVARPGEFPTVSGTAVRSLSLSLAFRRAHSELFTVGNEGLAVRVRPGTSRAEVEQWVGQNIKSMDVTDAAITTPPVERTIRLETTALWAVAALLTLVLLVLLVQLLQRQTAATQHELAILTGLGMTRRRLLALGALRGVFVGVLGAILAAVIAIVASPLTPVGLGRIADPSLGVHVDVMVLVLGAATLVLVSAAIGAVAVLRARRSARPRTSRPVVQLPNASGGWLAGVQLFTRHVRRRDASLLRATLGALWVVIAAAVAVLVLVGSLNALRSKPHLLGQTWDGVVVADQQNPPPDAKLDRAATQIAGVHRVAAVSRGSWLQLRAGDRSVNVQVFDDAATIRPSVASGRLPTRAGEVAMGADEMRHLHVHQGDEIELASDDTGKKARVRIVGTSVLVAPVFFVAAPGDGLTTNVSTMRQFGVDRAQSAALFLVRFRDRAAGQREVEQLQQMIGGSFAYTSRDKTVIEGINRIRTVPYALIVALALLAFAALLHAQLVSARRRRSDVAVARALGFSGGQIVGSFGVQATMLAVLAVLVGAPLGVLAGRLSWSRVASYLNVVPQPELTASGLAVLTTTVLAGALLIALPTALRAARLRASTILRVDE